MLLRFRYPAGFYAALSAVRDSCHPNCRHVERIIWRGLRWST